MAQPKAVIWDLDGVIADTAPFHFAAWQAAFARLGKAFSQEEFRRTFGQRNETIIPRVLGYQLPPAEIEKFSQKKEADFRRRARQGICLLPGAIELLEQLEEHGFRQALATSTTRGNIRLVFRVLNIGQFFRAAVCAEDVRQGKPAPDVFLTAASKLVVAAERCVVIEDSLAGVSAAKAANMKCLAVTTTNPREKLSHADLVVDSLAQVSWATMNSLLGIE